MGDYFAFDQAKLTEQAMQKITEAAAYASKFDGMVLTVVGHTDRAGASTYNAKLAEIRAEEVAAAIMAKGVPASIIKIRSFGEDTPAVETPDGRPESANRRVEIRVDAK